ncbi:succinate dehydrogenase, hydrophobic membrane anchor protein [Castellaniella sp.]|uniref:succinate dehydrogenase, hydrophobic membrane anchor protein n=1 Tax=Castellaniella sp. TaxID=1955812 RepID=UPI002AFE1EBD|nr:succinate dehydrogenase, hydrophobic membrane anchor protein [Castellaniella sp.]
MTHERIGRKRLVVGAHYGTRDFIVQRMTAVIMAVYTLILVFYAVFVPSLGFESWRAFFVFTVGALPVGQMLATVAFLSLIWHAWVGVRDIWMDYARSDGLRLFLQVLTALWLVAAAAFFIKILWSL